MRFDHYACGAGIASDQRKLELENSVLAYLLAAAVSQMSEAQKEAFQAITMRRLLTVSVDGFPFRPAGESYLKSALSSPVKNVRTRIFNYSNIPAYLVGVALTNAGGEDLFLYLNRNLFLPLHIEKSNNKNSGSGGGVCLLYRMSGEIRCMSGHCSGAKKYLLCFPGLSGNGPWVRITSMRSDGRLWTRKQEPPAKNILTAENLSRFTGRCSKKCRRSAG